MRIELTSKQCIQIQNEIIRLEEEKKDNLDKLNGWDFVYYNDRINELKKILNEKTINL